jgi:hypothetical protein
MDTGPTSFREALPLLFAMVDPQEREMLEVVVRIWYGV